MCWHRKRPHPIYLTPPPSATSLLHLRIAWCSKLTCHILTNGDYYLCDNCFVIKSYSGLGFAYQHVFSHFVRNGIEIHANCYDCGNSVLTEKSLSQCYVCTQEHLKLLTEHEVAERSIDRYRLITLTHSGHCFEILPDFSVYIFRNTTL